MYSTVIKIKAILFYGFIRFRGVLRVQGKAGWVGYRTETEERKYAVRNDVLITNYFNY